MQAQLRQLPSVDKLLQNDQLAPLTEIHGHALVVDAIRAELDLARQCIIAGQPVQSAAALVKAILARLSVTVRPSLQPVINATGVIIHTNLGRALLSQRAQQAMLQAASTYSNLEYDLEAGARGSRYTHAADLLCRLTGAEAAVVVNNNAGAVILALSALAKDKEVIISRSQLIEIGGGFRIPEIMAQSGAHLVEVGTTNRTYRQDFEQAIDPQRTGLLLSVHYSNYQIIGFTTQPTLAELAELAQAYHLPFMEDLGSGTLLDTVPFGLAHEPTIQESLAAGVDLVTASGDKLLGGPQAGLILGRAALIEQIKKHPLIRALRVDKTTLAALQATLLAYLEGKATTEIPVWRMIAADLATLTRRAQNWRRALRSLSQFAKLPLQVVDSISTVGGGSLPAQTLPTKALAVTVPSVDALAAQLRQADPPVIARIDNQQLLLDPRTVLPEQDKALVAALEHALTTFNLSR
ncbi:MAG: L-seryl-tRNA(Sec) selenium transferase [Chloroflexota bacterium]|nr:MAG: L-seryl-tRNA(Sec) selenium transferase [Chloroflexota bacterium]